MLTEENYQFAWTLYILASLGGTAVLWRLLGRPGWMQGKALFCLLLLALLLAPVKADPEQLYLAPAFLVCALEGVFQGADAMARAGGSLLQVIGLALLLGVSVQFGVRRYRQKQAEQEASITPSADEEREHAELLQESESRV